MVIWDTIVGGLLDKVAPEVAGYYRDKIKLKHDLKLAKINKQIARENAQAQYVENSENRDHEWELESIRNSGWKDELVIIVLTIPLVLVFVPSLAPYVEQGFKVLAQTPEWYRWMIVMIYAAVFGIRVWRRKV